MDYRWTFDSILQGSSRKRLDFDQQFGFFLFFVNWEMDYNYTFDSILHGYSRKRLDFDQQFGFFLFCFKVFWFFFLELNIFFKFSNNDCIKYFTAECLFSAALYKVSIKLFTSSARISQKRFISWEVHFWDGRSFFISLCFILLDFQFKFYIFSNTFSNL